MAKTWAISSLESDGLSEDMHKTFNAQPTFASLRCGRRSTFNGSIEKGPDQRAG
jgi:hypothetical protein